MYHTRKQLEEKNKDCTLQDGLKEVLVCILTPSIGPNSYQAMEHLVVSMDHRSKYEVRAELAMKVPNSDLYCLLPMQDYRPLYGTPTEQRSKTAHPNVVPNILVYTYASEQEEVVRINNLYYNQYLFWYEPQK